MKKKIKVEVSTMLNPTIIKPNKNASKNRVLTHGENALKNK